MSNSQGPGVTRRDLLKKGAALGGAVVWVTPVVQTVGMGRAFASTASPEPCSPAISYIAMNVVCGGDKIPYFIKWEAGGGWESYPGNAPGCGFTPSGSNAKNGDELGFEAKPSSGNSQVMIEIPVNCAVLQVAVKGGQNCDVFAGEFRGTQLYSCPKNPESTTDGNSENNTDENSENTTEEISENNDD